MKVLRPASEAEAIAAFLRAEFYQREFDSLREEFAPIVENPQPRQLL